jgi:ActR/RegA family two-component response regulator
MDQALIADSSEYWASQLRELLESLDVGILAWQTRGTGWTESLKTAGGIWVFVDDQLMSRSGLKCLEKIQEIQTFKGRVVFTHSLQGLAAQQLELMAYVRGARSILRKPYRVAELRKILSHAQVGPAKITPKIAPQ